MIVDVKRCLGCQWHRVAYGIPSCISTRPCENRNDLKAHWTSRPVGYRTPEDGITYERRSDG